MLPATVSKIETTLLLVQSLCGAGGGGGACTNANEQPQTATHATRARARLVDLIPVNHRTTPGYAASSSITKRAPGSACSSQTRPPIASTWLLTIARPRPEPPRWGRGAGGGRKK